MKITVLCPDLSTNCLGRALVLADILAQDHEVRVVGSRFGETVWPPAKEHPVEVVEAAGGIWPLFARSARSLVDEISGEVVVAVKASFPSLGIALLARLRKGIPVVLDMDDDETALRPIPAHPWRLLEDMVDPNGGVSRLVMRRAISQADAFTVASRTLRSRFGGELVWHAKNTDLLRPQKGMRELWRDRLGLGHEHVVLFLGTPRPWKGVEDAAYAVGLLDVPATLLVVGADETPYARHIASLPRVRTHGMVPLSSLPGILEAADLVVIPQRNEPITRAQMPSKLFDAMAMAKPIVATEMSDIGAVLGEDRGVLVQPGNVRHLAAAMERLLAAPELARQMGTRAREWCVANASLKAVRKPMNRALRKAVGRTP